MQIRKKHIIAFLFILLLKGPIFGALWTFQWDDKGYHESSLELDPYYSYIDYVMSLTETPVPRVYMHSERTIYWNMIKNIYRPRFLLMEASGYPLPVAGALIKKHYYDVYNDAQVNDNMNLVKVITDGFPEPAAFSLFLGNVINFVVGDGDKEEVVGKGYSGLLGSFGNYHIVNNTFIKDKWLEWEIKIKGEDIRKEHSISWSYGIGQKIHDNPDIVDTVYFSVKRNHILFAGSGNSIWSFFVHNITQEFRADFDRDELYHRNVTPTRYFLLVGKNIPLADGKVTLSLSLGGLRTFASGYSGSLEEQIDDSWSFIIRPNIKLHF